MTGGTSETEPGHPPVAYLTIFTAPKPFAEPHIGRIQRNAIRSWVALGPEVQAILVGDEPGIEDAAAEAGAIHLGDVKRNEHGTPLVSSIFASARGYDRTPFLAYVNADIILFDDFLEATRTAAGGGGPFVIVGQRWDLDVAEPLDLSAGWQDRLREKALDAGQLHPPGGSDYFAFPRECFTEIPPFAVGRAGWDNWMIYHARRHGWTVIDATASVLIIHQSHDYGHLPGGRPHYRLPESERNIMLAGGRRVIFSLGDATHLLVDGQIQTRPLGWSGLVRRIETFPALAFGSPALAQITYSLVHPVRAFRELKGWAGAVLKGLSKRRP
jgi:hypothetical protein